MLKETIMFARTLIAAALSLAAAGPVAAQTLKPIQSQRIDLGQVKGDAYYTVEQNGYRVVATFAERGATHVPVRVEAVLAPGQTVTFSAPREAGAPREAVEISRRNDQILVHNAAAVD